MAFYKLWLWIILILYIGFKKMNYKCFKTHNTAIYLIKRYSFFSFPQVWKKLCVTFFDLFFDLNKLQTELYVNDR